MRPAGYLAVIHLAEQHMCDSPVVVVVVVVLLIDQTGREKNKRNQSIIAATQ